MSTLDDIKALGLPVTWATVRAGWQGIGGLSPSLGADEVRAFALDQIDEVDASILSDVAELSLARDRAAIDAALSRLAPSVSGHAIRTWRAYLLTKLLSELPDAPIEGLSELTDFWNSLGFPKEMPHVVQGLRNDIGPNEYYNQDNYRRIVDRHREWLRSEIAALASAPHAR